jgi:hypothetical protein
MAVTAWQVPARRGPGMLTVGHDVSGNGRCGGHGARAQAAACCGVGCFKAVRATSGNARNVVSGSGGIGSGQAWPHRAWRSSSGDVRPGGSLKAMAPSDEAVGVRPSMFRQRKHRLGELCLGPARIGGRCLGLRACACVSLGEARYGAAGPAMAVHAWMGMARPRGAGHVRDEAVAACTSDGKPMRVRVRLGGRDNVWTGSFWPGAAGSGGRSGARSRLRLVAALGVRAWSGTAGNGVSGHGSSRRSRWVRQVKASQVVSWSGALRHGGPRMARSALATKARRGLSWSGRAGCGGRGRGGPVAFWNVEATCVEARQGGQGVATYVLAGPDGIRSDLVWRVDAGHRSGPAVPARRVVSWFSHGLAWLEEAVQARRVSGTVSRRLDWRGAARTLRGGPGGVGQRSGDAGHALAGHDMAGSGPAVTDKVGKARGGLAPVWPRGDAAVQAPLVEARRHNAVQGVLRRAAAVKAWRDQSRSGVSAPGGAARGLMRRVREGARFAASPLAYA